MSVASAAARARTSARPSKPEPPNWSTTLSGSANGERGTVSGRGAKGQHTATAASGSALILLSIGCCAQLGEDAARTDNHVKVRFGLRRLSRAAIAPRDSEYRR